MIDSGSCSSAQRSAFWRDSTGKERDAETGLDYFGARYYSGAQGRFTSTDPFNPITDFDKEDDFIAYLSQPQNWNRYSYTWNNPLRYIDPTGELVELLGDTEEALKRLKQMLGTTALGTRVENGHTFLTYTGKGDAKKALGDFGEMLSDPGKTVDFMVSKTYDTKDATGLSVRREGGGVTVGAEESRTGHTQVVVHPDGGWIANQLGTGPWGSTKSNDRGPLYFTNDVVDAHEFGHAWGQFKFGLPIRRSPATNPYSLEWENQQRAKHTNWRNRRARH